MFFSELCGDFKQANAFWASDISDDSFPFPESTVINSSMIGFRKNFGQTYLKREFLIKGTLFKNRELQLISQSKT